MTFGETQTEILCIALFEENQKTLKIRRVPFETPKEKKHNNQQGILPVVKREGKKKPEFINEVDMKDFESFKAEFIKDFEDHDSYTPLILNYTAYRSLDSMEKKESYGKTLPDFYVGEEIYNNCLDPNTYFEEFYEWCRSNDMLDLYNIYALSHLERIKDAICIFLPDITNVSVIRRGEKIQMLFTKFEKDFTIEQLSEGEKVLISLIGDIARRLHIANPHMNNPMHSDAIIMIDEVELHLHPRWQRNIIHNLRKVFPGVQFILTTHSPQVLGELKDEISIYKFYRKAANEISCEPIDSTFGRDSNYILEQFMDTRKENEQISKDLNQLFIHIASKEYAKAKILYDSLSSILTKQNPELVRAEILIRRGLFKR